MRGQYQSVGAAHQDGYAPDELAADIAAVASDIAPDEDEVHLLGHSLGGLIARHAVLGRATGVASLTLLGSGPGSITGRRHEVLRSMLGLIGADRAADPGRLRSWAEQLWEEHLEPQARAEGVAEHIIGFLRDRHLANCPTALVVMGNYLLSCPDRTAELARTGGPPILVMYGENDDAWPPEVQDRMGRRLRAQRVCIPGAAHSPAIEAPETTASTLTSFWNTAEEASRRRRRHGATVARRLVGEVGLQHAAISRRPAGTRRGFRCSVRSARPSQGRRDEVAARPSGQCAAEVAPAAPLTWPRREHLVTAIGGRAGPVPLVGGRALGRDVLGPAQLPPQRLVGVLPGQHPAGRQVM